MTPSAKGGGNRMEGIMIAHGLIRINKTTAIPLSSILEICGPYDSWMDDDGEDYDGPEPAGSRTGTCW